MSRTRTKKTTHITTDVVEQRTERESGDIYDDKQRGEMLKADGITAAENSFMQEREMKPEKKKRPAHLGTVSVQLAENEYKED